MKDPHKTCYSFLLIFLLTLNLPAQELYFPSAEKWEKRQASELGIDVSEAIEFARENEYSESKDLRQAILKGFQREPYHEIPVVVTRWLEPSKIEECEHPLPGSITKN